MTSVNHHENLRQRHLKHVTSVTKKLNEMSTLNNTQTTQEHKYIQHIVPRRQTARILHTHTADEGNA